jgi:hypothetical protein
MSEGEQKGERTYRLFSVRLFEAEKDDVPTWGIRLSLSPRGVDFVASRILVLCVRRIVGQSDGGICRIRRCRIGVGLSILFVVPCVSADRRT